MTVDLLAIGAHPDDAELGCGASLARHRQAGRTFAVVSLTRGERGTRGTPEQRAREARAAGAILGAEEVVLLNHEDGALRADRAAEDALIAELRRWRPRVVLAPPPRDRHPDHERAYALTRSACYYAGLRKRGEGEPHRPGLVLSYQLHDPFEPTVVIDVTDSWATKIEALRAHRSQFADPNASGADPGPSTWVGSTEFWEAIEGKARYFGAMIGCALGEPFLAHGPLAVEDLAALPGMKTRR